MTWLYRSTSSVWSLTSSRAKASDSARRRSSPLHCLARKRSRLILVRPENPLAYSCATNRGQAPVSRAIHEDGRGRTKTDEVGRTREDGRETLRASSVAGCRHIGGNPASERTFISKDAATRDRSDDESPMTTSLFVGLTIFPPSSSYPTGRPGARYSAMPFPVLQMQMRVEQRGREREIYSNAWRPARAPTNPAV